MVDVLVICRKCGKKAPSSEFRVNPELKMAVCSGCQKTNLSSKTSFNPSVKNTPVTFDKKQNTIVTEKIENVPPKSWNETFKEPINKTTTSSLQNKSPNIDSEKTIRICKKCKYKYKYDSVNNKPNKCPYCMTPSKSVFD
jgi:hypothetical protein